MRESRRNYALRRRIAEWVFASRARSDLTQAELASRVRCRRTTIERIENGGCGASIDMISEIAAALNTTFTIGEGK